MRLRIVAIMLVGWSFVGLPAVCEVGGMVHACDCAPGAVCEHGCECHDDPCGAAKASPDSWRRHELLVITGGALPLDAVAAVTDSQTPPIDRPPAICLPRLAYPASDLPFRI